MTRKKLEIIRTRTKTEPVIEIKTLPHLELASSEAQEESSEVSFEVIEKLAEAGDISYSFLLANFYLFGQGVEENFDMAFEWLDKCDRLYRIQFQESNPLLREALVTRITKGNLSDSQEEKLYEKLAEFGNCDAQIYMMVKSIDGDLTTDKLEKAAYWYERISQNKECDSISSERRVQIDDLGCTLYSEGQKALQEAKKYEKENKKYRTGVNYKAAAAYGIAEAQYVMGKYYFFEIHDIKKSLYWLDRAVRNKYQPAEELYLYVKKCYLFDEGVKKTDTSMLKEAALIYGCSSARYALYAQGKKTGADTGSYCQDLQVKDLIQLGEALDCKIFWRVLEKQEDKMLVISEQCILDTSIRREKNSDWETSNIREELNTIYFNKWFNEDERKLILKMDIPKSVNPEFNTIQKGTQDRLFLLSIEEVMKYFKTWQLKVTRGGKLGNRWVRYNMKTRPAACCLYSYPYEEIYESKITQKWTNWWLRSKGANDKTYAYINGGGDIELQGAKYTGNDIERSTIKYIRPAMWVTIK